MNNLKIGVVGDNGSIIDFNIDADIINGLYSTTDNKKVEENIQNFDIQIESLENGIARKMSKRNDVVIITVLIDNENKYQYLVVKDINLDELDKTDEIPLQLKPLIKDAYNLIKEMTLGDLLK